ncbi:MAG TPA: AAA family ATPase [Bryobacteraceae bacterium]|nr:AAA family ATPase [Bryobacteraceae bacterium]
MSSRDAYNPLQEAGDAVTEYLDDGHQVDAVSSKETGKGLFIGVLSGQQQRRYILYPVSTPTPQAINPEPTTTTIMVGDLGAFRFDPTGQIAPERWLYDGLLAAGDLAVWLGREKHRKSNLILQFAISAAVGCDYLGFKFTGGDPLKVVYIDFESKSGSLHQRYEAIAKAMGLTPQQRQTLDRNLEIIEVRKIRKSGKIFPKFPYKPNQETDRDFWERLVANHPADLYIIDPLRSLHSADENDSSIETLLSEMQRIFKGAAVIAAHHMRKQAENASNLTDDMRAFSDGARGSSAIKAHSDVIVLQERTLDSKGDEIVHLGAFLKDGPDIEPFPVIESDHQSFYWEMVVTVPEKLENSYDALVQAGGKFRRKSDAADKIKAHARVGRATAFRHVDDMLRAKLLVEDSGWLRVQKIKT